jgi:hypothetical protein
MYQTQLNRPPRVFGRVGLFLGAPGRAHSLGGVSPRAAKHESTTLELIPTINGNNLSRSVTWTDFVAGGRFSMPLSSKASVDVFGDAGEGGATLDYQFGGFVNYQVKPKLVLQGGWRYLTAHYGNNGTVFTERFRVSSSAPLTNSNRCQRLIGCAAGNLGGRGTCCTSQNHSYKFPPYSRKC